jgi:hypothetical protein
MATWKRLTNVEGQKVDINLDAVAYIEPQTDGGSWIHFVGGRISEGRTFALAVKETPDAIRVVAAKHIDASS